MLEPHLAKKPIKNKQNSNNMNSQPIQNFSMPRCTEKTGGFPCCQMLAPNLLGRCRPTKQGQKQHQMDDGKMKKGWKPFFPPQNKLVQDSEGNEEKRYPIPDHNKTKIDYPKEPNKPQKNTLKEEIPENFMEMLLNKVNKMYRRHSRNSKNIKIKNMRRHKKNK
jgi:hypothetical protein